MERLDEFKASLTGKRIAVVLGGWSGEREVSLRSGTNVLASLKRQGIECFPIDPRQEDWLTRLLSSGADAVFLALHGKGGEDGTIQGLLETVGIPYTGSGVRASAVAMNKVTTKQILLAEGLPTPPYVAVSQRDDFRAQARRIGDALGFPLVVKPTSEGSSLGVSIVRTREELFPILHKTAYDYKTIFAEKFVAGMEITIGVLGAGDRMRAMPILELVPKTEFYDYDAKYTDGMTEFHCPARLTLAVTERTQELAVRAHEAVGCHGYCRVDMRVTASGEPFITEINTLPGLTDLSDLPAEAKTAGIPYDALILEILESAFAERTD